MSPIIHSRAGVNQGGISIGLLFREYMVDVGDYSNSHHGIAISDEILFTYCGRIIWF